MKTKNTTAKAVAVRLLARREHSAHEIEQKLIQREFVPGEIAQAITELQHADLLSDLRFTEAYIRMRQLKGYGPVRIRMELKQRGVADHLIEQHLNTDRINWLTLLQQQYVKKYRNTDSSDYADRAKRIRFLQYRGFTLEMIRQVIK